MLGLFVGCWSAKPESSTPIATDVEPNTLDLTGSYWCSFDSPSPDQSRHPCQILKRRGKLELVVLGGAERVRGSIILSEDGFTFEGTLRCSFADCDSELHGRFETSGRGGFKGTFREDAMVLYLVPAPYNAFGGSSYGGDEYGFGAHGSPARDGSNYRRPLIDNRGQPRP
ncbi:MAG: hypothetical protein WKG01_26325 [Kofleriaceae bacterium]